MKRSRGVTILAVWLIVYGAFATLAGIWQVVARPTLKTAFEQQVQQFSKTLDELPQGTSPGQIAPERIQHFRELLAQNIRQFHKTLQSPVTLITLCASFLLAVAELVAGLALFLLKGWGRILAIWESVLSLYLELWSTFSDSLGMGRLQHEYMQLLPENGVANVPLGRFYRSALAWGIDLVFDVVFPILWTVLLIWFLNRASVKAQFQRRR